MGTKLMVVGILTAAILVTAMSGYMPAWAAQKTSTTKTKTPFDFLDNLCGVTPATVAGTVKTTITTWDNGKTTIAVAVHGKILDGDVQVGTFSSTTTLVLGEGGFPLTTTLIVNVTCKGSGHQSSESVTLLLVVDENGEVRATSP